MNKNEKIIQEFFEEKGFSANKIPESDEKSPDFIVADKEYTYLIEYKIKDEEEGFEENRKATFKKGEIFSVEENLGRNNTISKRIKIGKNQLNIKIKEKIDFKIIWYHAAGKFPDVRFHKIKATLCGLTDIMFLDKQGSMPCFYFTFSDFYRYKDSLDAAIITQGSEAQLCINNHSPNYEMFKNTRIFDIFRGGICDPLAEEAKGKAYIVDCDIDRRNESKVLQYIQKKYGEKKIINMPLKMLSGEIAINKNT